MKYIHLFEQYLSRISSPSQENTHIICLFLHFPDNFRSNYRLTYGISDDPLDAAAFAISSACVLMHRDPNLNGRVVQTRSDAFNIISSHMLFRGAPGNHYKAYSIIEDKDVSEILYSIKKGSVPERNDIEIVGNYGNLKLDKETMESIPLKSDQTADKFGGYILESLEKFSWVRVK